MRPGSASVTTSSILRYKSVASAIDGLNRLAPVYRNLPSQTKDVAVNGTIVSIKIVIEGESD